MVLLTFSSVLMSSEVKIAPATLESDDWFGESVSISGSYAIIGARGEGTGGWANYTDEGCAYIYIQNGATWEQQQKIVASDRASEDYFGYSVSISGDYAIVGAPFDDDDGSLSGSAYIFVRSGTTWTQQQKLVASDAAASDFFGTAVSISNDYAIVSAYGNDDAGNSSGSAYIFVRSGTTWTQQQKLVASDAAIGDFFSWSLSISGDYAIVGAYSDDDSYNDSGSAYIFVRSGTTWTQQQKLVASDAAAADYFGNSVSISGDYAIVGMRNDDDDGYGSGSSYIFVRSGTTWTQQGKVVASDAASEDYFGNSVSISGDYAIVGAHKNDDAGNSSGSAYIFVRSGTTWTQREKLVASDATTGDWFGYSVSIDGTYAIVGAYQDGRPLETTVSGSAYIYPGGDVSLPVQITSFTATSTRSEAITLEWVTESEVENLGFIVERRHGEIDWVEIATYMTHSELRGQGSVSSRTEYTFTDATVDPVSQYDYRLADVSYGGVKEYHGMSVLGVEVFAVPEGIMLMPAYPNPFNPSTTIRYELGSSCPVEILIYNIRGQVVWSNKFSEHPAGQYDLQWDGVNMDGEGLPGGVYFISMQTPAYQTTQKVVLIK